MPQPRRTDRIKALKRKLAALLKFLSSKQGIGLVQYGLLMAIVVVTATAYGRTLAHQINQTYISLAGTLTTQVR